MNNMFNTAADFFGSKTGNRPVFYQNRQTKKVIVTLILNRTYQAVIRDAAQELQIDVERLTLRILGTQHDRENIDTNPFTFIVFSIQGISGGVDYRKINGPLRNHCPSLFVKNDPSNWPCLIDRVYTLGDPDPTTYDPEFHEWATFTLQGMTHHESWTPKT